MFRFLDNMKKKMRDWAVRHASGPHAKLWLSILSFSEASFFPVPPDILLVGILLARERLKWVFYATLTTVFSVLGGAFGYALGFMFFDVFGEQIVSFYGLEEQMRVVSEAFSQNAFWTIFAAAFTPIPYKVFTLAAGLFNINFVVFMLASLAGRGIRFFATGYVLKLYGERIANVLYTYFNIFSLVALLALFVLVYIFV
ncbi:MAG: YqaA family protein [Patescibacteria group bacterium]|nr:MAG: YqaA family protein [Patescibacteria group bacterium]